MSLTPEPLEAAAPRDPASYRPPRLLGPGFWAMIAFSVLCVMAGAAMVTFAPRLFAKPAPARVADIPPATAIVTPRAERSPAGGELAPAPATAAPAPSEEISRLNDRLAALEERESQMAQAAAGALAAAALVEASQSSRPFTDELSALETVSPPSTELRSLRRLAELGAPSHTALAASFPDYAARAAAASRAPGEGAGLMARIGYALSRVVSLRRVGDVPGKGADAVLAKAERMVEDGDLDQALAVMDGLPLASRESLAPWRAGAERRAEIDRRVIAVRTEALEGLARISRTPAAGGGA
jgi:hypothetical protein